MKMEGFNQEKVMMAIFNGHITGIMTRLYTNSIL